MNRGSIIIYGNLGTYKMLKRNLTGLGFTSAEVSTKSEKSTFRVMMFSIERVAREFNLSCDMDDLK
jgi:hypothetical protein